jgi:hypothetical protein
MDGHEHELLRTNMKKKEDIICVPILCFCSSGQESRVTVLF